jgi:hypothetical protein
MHIFIYTYIPAAHVEPGQVVHGILRIWRNTAASVSTYMHIFINIHTHMRIYIYIYASLYAAYGIDAP